MQIYNVVEPAVATFCCFGLIPDISGQIFRLLVPFSHFPAMRAELKVRKYRARAPTRFPYKGIFSLFALTPSQYHSNSRPSDY